MAVVSAPTITLNPFGDTPLAALVEFETDEPAKVALEVSDGSETRTIYFGDFATSHEVPVFGLKPDTDYTVDVRYMGSDGVFEAAATDLEVTTDPLPDDFPTVTTLVSEPDMMEPGFTMFQTGPVVIIDNKGDVVWYVQQQWRQFEQLSTKEFGGAYDGQFIWQDLDSDSYRISDLLGRELAGAAVKDVGELPPFHHELWVTENDTLMTLGRTEIEVDGYPTSETDPTPRDEPTLIEDEAVIEFDADGNILNVWNFSDIIDPTRVGYGSFLIFDEAPGLDWVHSNAVITDPSDNTIIASSRHQDAVIKFDRDTGQLVWILGPHENWTEEFQPYLLEPVGEPFEWQYHQHAIEFTADGNLLLFDNGNFRASPYDGSDIVPPEENYSRAVKYAINEDTMEVSQTWEYVPDPRIFSGALGDADEQPLTGNVLANFGFVSDVGGVSSSDLGKGPHHVRVIEVTQEETPEVVFDVEIDLPDPEARSTNYRADRLASLYPSEVSVFQLHAGDDEDNAIDGDFTDDEIRGLGGDDTLDGGAGDNHLNGGEGDDVLEGGDGRDGLYGREGNDALRGNGGDDDLSGAWGDDTLEGGEGEDNLRGWSDNDILNGDGGDDTLDGGAGNDHLDGGEGDDVLEGGDGRDGLYGREGNDALRGNGGDDDLSGAWGDDTLEGGEGQDNLRGWSDNDSLIGGAGDDTQTGGAGMDTFHFAGADFGQDILTDFVLAEDTIVFEGVGGADDPDDLTYTVGDFGGAPGQDIRITFAGLGDDLSDERIDVLDVGSDIDALKADMLFV